MKRPRLATWRSEKAEQRFRAMEDELIRERWPVPPASRDVPTSFGQTHVYEWPGTGTPIVLLHGMGGTGWTWAQIIDLLVGRRLFAIDTMGDVGRSVQSTVFEGPDDLATWLDETLAGLGVDRAHLVGTSYGGFLALNLAARRPTRVAAVTLVDPAGVAPFRLLRFMLWGLPVLAAALMPAPARRWIARRFRMPLAEDRRMIRLALHAQLNHPFRLPPPDPLTDDELRSITVPVQLLAAAKSEPFDPRIAVERAALIPHVTTEAVPDAGHALQLTHAELCASRVSHVTDATL